MDEAENQDIQGNSSQLKVEETKFPQGGFEVASATVEQLTDEEKSTRTRQEIKEASDGDTIQEGDPKQAAEEGSTQENTLKQKNKKMKVG